MKKDTKKLILMFILMASIFISVIIESIYYTNNAIIFWVSSCAIIYAIIFKEDYK